MATKKKSPMTSFSSFEELASSDKVQNFNNEFESIKHKISSILSNKDATKKNPIECSNYIKFLTIDDEAQGLSELQKPRITQIFQNEGIIWVKIEGNTDYTEFNELTLSDVRNILLWLRENIQFNKTSN